ncbi:hypothetical protein [Thalassoporum mexicanum]|uniref:hypothetical protein n=1 Tax=Thalassoporum mexicanum TaxID=3457544 RepID=UPI000318797E|nr:hypothetical protein [Pseudanabaena sp. PCC 7367]
MTDQEGSIQSLAQIWAKKYVGKLKVESGEQSPDQRSIEEIASKVGRTQTANQLLESLRYASAQAWAKTETLLAKQVKLHDIKPELIDPWQIADDSRLLFEKSLAVYTEQHAMRSVELSSITNPDTATITTALPTPGQLSVAIAKDVGNMRHKYTATNPLVLGFVSMQFHHSGQLLLDLLSPAEKALVGSYFKVIDDHLYMPLQRSYEAAAKHEFDSPQLKAVRSLLPISSEIALQICDRVGESYPTYQCHTGALTDPAVLISSIRDVEMFQTYLCLCVLVFCQSWVCELRERWINYTYVIRAVYYA